MKYFWVWILTDDFWLANRFYYTSENVWLDLFLLPTVAMWVQRHTFEVGVGVMLICAIDLLVVQ